MRVLICHTERIESLTQKKNQIQRLTCSRLLYVSLAFAQLDQQWEYLIKWRISKRILRKP